MPSGNWRRKFPFLAGAKTCPECSEAGETVEMEEDYVRAPAIQDHWRGVEAWVCPECDRVEYKDDDLAATI